MEYRTAEENEPEVDPIGWRKEKDQLSSAGASCATVAHVCLS